MKKVTVEPKPDKLLQMQNGYKIAAATWLIEAGMKDVHKYYQDLNEQEQQKVKNEVDKLLEVIRNKRTKWHHGKEYVNTKRL